MALLDSIVGAESGGDPTARNPNSSATGLGQFVSGTWADMMARYRPDLTEGKTPDQILALRNDPALSREMTQNYATENQAKLTAAGHEATPGNSYLAHFAGPQGALSVLGADPSTPIDKVLTPAAIKANPFLAGMTAGDLKAWADRKMGGTAQPPTQLTPQGPQPPAQSPQGIPPAQPPQLPQTASMSPPEASQGGGGFYNTIPAQQMPQMQFIPPPPHKPINLNALKLALQQAPALSRGFAFRG